MSEVRNMKLLDWINFKVDPNDIWWNAVDPTGADRDNRYIPLGCAKCPTNPLLFTNNPDVNSNLVFYSFTRTCNTRTRFKKPMMWGEDWWKRTKIAAILDKTYTMTPLPPDKYFDEIGKYKFVISPEGNGIDCYRHYETWLSKGIPIMQYNTLMASKYKGLPILWTRDYSEINDNYLNKKYEEFLNNSFDFRRVLLSSYLPELQRQIHTVMNAPNHTSGAAHLFAKGKYWNYSDYFR